LVSAKRSVGDRQPAVAHPDGRRRVDRLQRLGGDEHAGGSESRAAIGAFAVRHGVQLLFFEIDKAQVLS